MATQTPDFSPDDAALAAALARTALFAECAAADLAEVVRHSERRRIPASAPRPSARWARWAWSPSPSGRWCGSRRRGRPSAASSWSSRREVVSRLRQTNATTVASLDRALEEEKTHVLLGIWALDVVDLGVLE
jgi:hypothetical protein